jgi:chemotaxis signal transduction protein/nucleoid-associated protein YgaU
MPTNQDDTLLIFRIDCIPCAVVASSVQSIVMPPEHLTRPPGSDRGQPGIFRHAGHIYTVVDLRRRFGIDTPRQGTGRLLLHEHGNRRHALRVDEVVGLVRSEEGQWATLPPYLPRSLFYSGFLYRQEIILCTTLDALLAMHDAEPIRRHLEQLRRTAKNEESATTDRPVAEPPAGNEQATVTEPHHSPVPRPHVMPPSSDTSHRCPPSRPVVAPRPVSRARPTPAKVTRSRSPLGSPPRRKPLTPTPSPARRQPPERGDHHPADIVRHAAPDVTPRNHGDSRWLAWLLLAALLAAAGALYLMAPEKRITTITDYSTPAPDYVPPPKAADRAPPQAVATGRAPLPALPTAASAVEEDGTAAVQIERDAEGTITLIIQREHLHTRRNLPPAGSEAGSATPGTAAAEANRPVVVPGKEKGGTDTAPQDEAEWAAPAALPEPCDCTHIVVKGDTLWAIAEHYTNSAFNYPELARQSGIRNPHRIYPGNKVRIIVR